MILTNKTVCITAGNKGLGGEIVKLLVDKCKKVIVIDRSDPVYSHKKIVHIKVDLLKEKPDIEDVDIFISNLGMTLGPKELWFYKNIRWKKFVFINSVMSYVGLENYSMYSACKSFIRIFNQSLLREKADTLIVYPYKINTSMFSEVTDFCTLDACDVAKSVNNNLLISTDGYDIKTVMQDLKKFIIKDFPDLYEKMKKEEDIDNEKVVSKKYKPKIDSLKNYRKEMKKEEDIDNEKVVSKKYKPKIDSLKNYRKEIKKEEDIDNEKVVSKKYKPKIDSLKNYRKLLLDPYSKERSKKMKQANIKDFQYIQTEEGKVFLILN
ncbi:hypothetical protein P3W45_000384 [Vairimorpha bombi]